MNSPEYSQHQFSPQFTATLDARKKKVLADIAALVQKNGIEDPVDQKIVAEAVAFAENPTENVKDFETHTTNLGAVMGGFEMMGMDIPTEIIVLHNHLYAGQCINRLQVVEVELEKSSPDAAVIQEAMTYALDCATTLAKPNGANDGTYLAAVTELQKELQNR